MGNPTLVTRTYPAITFNNAWLSGQPAIATSTVYMLKQTGANRYLATDGTVSGIVTLRSYDALLPGDAAIYVTPFSGTTAAYNVTSATPTTPGTGYVTGDVLTFANGVTLTVTATTGGVVSAAVTTGGSSTTNTPTTGQTQTSATGTPGTGAVFTFVYALIGGAPAAVYAKSIKNKSVKTWDDKVYNWNPFNAASMVGQADLPRNIATGTEQLTDMKANEKANLTGGAPYVNPNVGVTPKTSQMFATAGVPGGTGESYQTTANVGGASGIFNPSSRQRKAPTERKARLQSTKDAIND